jgi:hypothetical protein
VDACGRTIMMVQSVHRFLVEFKPDEPAETMREPANEPSPSDASPFFSNEPPDVDALTQEAFERGREEARAEAALEHENALARVREEAEEALAAARAQWVTEESEALSARLTEGLAALEASLAEKTARALRPFLRESVREQAIAALCETLGRLLHSQPAAKLDMSGPEDLLDAVMRRLNGYEGKIAIHVTSERDIRVVCDETTIETQIALWAKSLAIDDA